MAPVYLSTVALERHRWKKAAAPATQATRWIEPARSCGFDGLELFERHLTEATKEEHARLLAAKEFIAVLNGYARFDAAAGDERSANARDAAALECRGIKFNVGPDAAKRAEYAQSCAAWFDSLPQRCRPWCECHGGTVIETPASAYAFFAALETPMPGIIAHLTTAQSADHPAGALAWLEQFGPNLTHIHVQTRSGLLEESPDASERAIRSLVDAGFSGSWTLEFTKGTAKPDETTDQLWENLQRDFAFLKTCLSAS